MGARPGVESAAAGGPCVAADTIPQALASARGRPVPKRTVRCVSPDAGVGCRGGYRHDRGVKARMRRRSGAATRRLWEFTSHGLPPRPRPGSCREAGRPGRRRGDGRPGPRRLPARSRRPAPSSRPVSAAGRGPPATRAARPVALHLDPLATALPAIPFSRSHASSRSSFFASAHTSRTRNVVGCSPAAIPESEYRSDSRPHDARYATRYGLEVFRCCIASSGRVRQV